MNTRTPKPEFTVRFKLWLFGGMCVAGFLLHDFGRLALLAFPLFFVLMIFALIKKNGHARGLGLLSLAVLLFFIFSIIGDMANPPSARCADGSLSFSAHHQGTCSWHGGVNEWNPPQWWER
jgi:hypothetical protein